MGLMWLSTVPPTSGLVSLMFGTRWLATLYGFAFFSHQVGGFLGAWMGGLLYERTGSYDIVWWLAVAVRPIVGGDQSADRGEARAAGCSPPPHRSLRPVPRGGDDGDDNRTGTESSAGARRPSSSSAAA